MTILQGILGIAIFYGIGWALSENRKLISWRKVAIGIGLQFTIAALFLYFPGMSKALLVLNEGVIVLEQVTLEATQFMFGFLAGGDPPYEVTKPNNNFIVAFRVLPLILFISAISAVLFHLQILPKIIGLFSKLLQKTLGVSGALGFAAASSVFLGIIETPLLIQPYLPKLKRSELFAMMVCGMSTVAGTVMVLYASVVGSVIEGALGHILVASIISVPAALTLSHLFIPSISVEGDSDNFEDAFERKTTSMMEALIIGTLDGAKMIANIVAIIIVFFACVYLINRGLALIPTDVPLTLQGLVAYLLYPFVWLMGIEAAEVPIVANLMGTKTVLNEFVAYLQMANSEVEMSTRSKLIATYALCGFSNLGSLGIVVGGLGSVMPDRREEIIELGIKSVFAGMLCTMLTGTIVGILT